MRHFLKLFSSLYLPLVGINSVSFTFTNLCTTIYCIIVTYCNCRKNKEMICMQPPPFSTHPIRNTQLLYFSIHTASWLLYILQLYGLNSLDWALRASRQSINQSISHSCIQLVYCPAQLKCISIGCTLICPQVKTFAVIFASAKIC